MAKKEGLPFKRGETYYTSSTPDTTSQHPALEGKTYFIEDNDWTPRGIPVTYRTGRYDTLMLVRNVSGGAILPKQLCHMKTSGSGYEFSGQVDAVQAAASFAQCFPADEFLPAAGVANNDLFYVVTAGPATVTTDTAGTTTIAVGGYVIPGGTTAGRVIAQDLTVAAGAATFNQIQGAVGIAITAVAANSTDLLINVIPKVI